MLLQDALVLVVLCWLSAHTVRSEEQNNNANKGNGTLSCGITNATSTHNASKIRIIHSQEAEKGAWPWMAEIYTSEGNKTYMRCGGALLNRFYVITAAHCVVNRGEPRNPKELTVRLGDHDLKSDKDGMKPVNSNVTSITIHEDFNPVNYANDIALLRLEHPVNFNNHIQSICLPEYDDPPKDEERETLYGYVAGWGYTTLSGPPNDVLMEMTAEITNDKDCQEAYEGVAIVTDGNICSVGINGSSPCKGFGGAPVVLPGRNNRYHIVGIVSFGHGCGNPEYPDVHTRVSEYLDWIGEYVI